MRHATCTVHHICTLHAWCAAHAAGQGYAGVMQVTQALGRSVVRTLGYVETPGETLQIILEASAGSVLRMVEDGKFGAECAVRLSTACFFGII